ncbi:hypothetical protein Scep_019033 [Stephania cephalantha]|uniref:Uncharacterized protein n=1 Tax=Stephania cephalantha TaxID=152367 RepID=A0AAP0I9Z1_9MAGN
MEVVTLGHDFYRNGSRDPGSRLPSHFKPPKTLVPVCFSSPSPLFTEISRSDRPSPRRPYLLAGVLALLSPSSLQGAASTVPRAVSLDRRPRSTVPPAFSPLSPPPPRVPPPRRRPRLLPAAPLSSRPRLLASLASTVPTSLVALPPAVPASLPPLSLSPSFVAEPSQVPRRSLLNFPPV